MSRIFKRFYHPGYGSYNFKKICLPRCPDNTISKYYKPVWGNKIQEIQLDENEFLYNTNEINYYSTKIRKLFNNQAIYIPTSHNTPVKTALRSCRNLSNLDNYLIKLNVLNITDDDGDHVRKIPKNKLTYTLNSKISEKLKNVSTLTFVSDLKDTVMLPDYNLVNTKFTYRLDNDYYINFRVDNILNEQYQLVNNYATADRSFYIGIDGEF